MDAYIFQAAMLCRECAEQIRRDISNSPTWFRCTSEDSEVYPQGPYANGGGEADTPQHCNQCGVFLENPLTPDGDTYVRELAEPFNSHDASWEEVADAARQNGQPVLAEWLEYYFAPGM